MNQSARVVAVEILGQQYPIRSTLPESYVADLAAYVDEKIRSAADVTPTTDTVRLVVLAALNIADECFHALDADRDGRAAPPRPPRRHGAPDRRGAAGIGARRARPSLIRFRLDPPRATV